MFGKVIYYDRDAINDCLAVISGKIPTIVGERKTKNTKHIGLSMSAVDAGFSGEEECHSYSAESLLLNCFNLEKELSGKDDYFDTSLSSATIDIKTIERGSILKCECSITIPEAFDTTQLINDFKSLLISGMDRSVGSVDGAEQLKDIIDNAEISKVPIELETSDILLCSKLDASKMMIDIKDFEDYEYEELSVLMRITNSGMLSPDMAYYDPLKDYLKLSRAIRRQIKDRNETIRPIKPDQEYKKVEVIAIYQ